MEQEEFNKLKDAIVEAKQEMKQSQARIDKLVDELMKDQDTSILLDAILHANRRKGHRHWPPPWRPWVYEAPPEKQKKCGGALDHHLIDDWGGLNRSDGGFSDEEIQIIVEIANSLKSTLQDDIQFLDEVIEQMKDPSRTGVLSDEQLARLDYIAKHNRGLVPWKPIIAPLDDYRYFYNKDDYNPKDLTNYVVPRMGQKEVDELLAKLKEQGILKSTDVAVVLSCVIDMLKEMEPRTRGFKEAIQHCEKIKEMLKAAGF